MTDKLALSPEEVAATTGLSLSTVYRSLETGALPGHKIGNRWVTLRSQLEERIRDDRVPKPRQSADPHPLRRSRQRGRFDDKVVEIGSRRKAA